MLTLIAALSFAATYELADLKALEKQQGWAELVDHLGDIPPAKRDKDWESLAERAGVQWLGTFKLDKPATAEAPLEAAESLMTRYPFLKQSRPFLAKRADVAVKAYGLSFSNYRHSAGDDEWLAKVRAFAEGDTLTPDLPLRFAKEVVLGRLIAVTAFPLFKLSADRGNKTLCKDAEFQKTLVAAFEEGVWPKESSELASKCWDDIKGPLTKALEAATGNAVRRNLCPVLAAKGALPAAQKDACERAAQ